jgi:hypothetical protein
MKKTIADIAEAIRAGILLTALLKVGYVAAALWGFGALRAAAAEEPWTTDPELVRSLVQAHEANMTAIRTARGALHVRREIHASPSSVLVDTTDYTEDEYYTFAYDAVGPRFRFRFEMPYTVPRVDEVWIRPTTVVCDGEATYELQERKEFTKTTTGADGVARKVVWEPVLFVFRASKPGDKTGTFDVLGLLEYRGVGIKSVKDLVDYVSPLNGSGEVTVQRTERNGDRFFVLKKAFPGTYSSVWFNADRAFAIERTEFFADGVFMMESDFKFPEDRTGGSLFPRTAHIVHRRSPKAPPYEIVDVTVEKVEVNIPIQADSTFTLASLPDLRDGIEVLDQRVRPVLAYKFATSQGLRQGHDGAEK